MWTIVADCWFENIFLPAFALKSPNKIVMYLETDQIHVLVLHRSCPLYDCSYPHMGHAHSDQYDCISDVLILYVTSYQ
jgi:hypothetical protein